jgi:hypothetical protein
VRASREASTVLELGARGDVAGTPFTVVGCTNIRGRRGVLWNEWNLRCDDGRMFFLAESAGALTLYEEGSITPALGELVIGGPVDTGFIVVERGEATRVARWGEVEDAPATYAYADLSSRSGAVATIDFGGTATSPSRVFVGRRVTFSELGLSSVRVASPRLVLVPELSRPNGVETWLDVGDEGELDDTRYRVLGMLSRRADGGTGAPVSWDEYLLFAPRTGLRWLVVSDGHWTFVETIDAAQVDDPAGEGETITLDGVTYAALSEGEARVEWATGTLPWAIEIGETSHVKDFLHSPWILTRERTRDELTWSRGVYVPPDVIAKAFGKRSLPRPVGRAPNED